MSKKTVTLTGMGMVWTVIKKTLNNVTLGVGNTLAGVKDQPTEL